MESKLHPGDEQNGSFEPGIRSLKSVKPGIKSGQQSQEKAEGNHDRRVRCEAKEIPQASLAQRIREREER